MSTFRLQLFVLRKCPSYTFSSTCQLFVFNCSYYGSVPPILFLQLVNFSSSTVRITEVSLLYFFFNLSTFRLQLFVLRKCPSYTFLQLVNFSSSTVRITEVSLLYLFFNFSTFSSSTFRIAEVSPLCFCFNLSTFRLQLFVLRKCPSYTFSSTCQLFVFNCSYYGSVPPILFLQLVNFSSSTVRITEVSLLYFFFNLSTFRLQLFALRKCPSCTCSSTFQLFRLQLFVLRKCPSYTFASTCQLFVFNCLYYGSVPPILVLQLFNFSSSTFRITEVSLLYFCFNLSTFRLQLFVLRKCPSYTCSSTFQLFVFNFSYCGSVPSYTFSSTCQLFVFNCSYYGSVPPILFLQLVNFSSSTVRITEVSLLYFFFNLSTFRLQLFVLRKCPSYTFSSTCQLFVFNCSYYGSVPPILFLQLVNFSSSTVRITEVSLLYLFFNFSTFSSSTFRIAEVFPPYAFASTFQLFVFNCLYYGSVPPILFLQLVNFLSSTVRITEVSLLYFFFNLSTFRLQLFVLRKCPSYTFSSTCQLFVFNCSYYGSVPPILFLQLVNFSSSTVRITEVSLLYFFFNLSTFRLQLFVLRKCPSYTFSSPFQLFVVNFSYCGSVPPILVLQLFNCSSSTVRITEVSLLYFFFNLSTFRLQLFVLRKCPSYTCSSPFQLFVVNFSYCGSVPPILVLQLFNCSSSTFRITEVSLLYLFFNFQLFVFNFSYCGSVPPTLVLQLFNFSSLTFRITEVSLLYFFFFNFSTFRLQLFVLRKCPSYTFLQLLNFSSSTVCIAEVSLLYLFFNFSTFRLQLFVLRKCPSYTCSSTFQFFVFNFSYCGSVPPIYLFFNFSTFLLQLFVLRKCPSYTCSSIFNFSSSTFRITEASLLYLFFNFQFFVFNFSYCGSVPPILVLQLFNFPSSTFRSTEVSLLYLFFNFSTFRLQLFVLRKSPSYTCSSTFQLFVFNFSYCGSVPPLCFCFNFSTFSSSTFRIAEVFPPYAFASTCQLVVFNCLYYGSVPPILFLQLVSFSSSTVCITEVSLLYFFFNLSTFRLQLFVLRKCPSYTCSSTLQLFVFNFSNYGSVPPILVLQLFNFPSSTFRITEESLLYLFFNFSTFRLQLFVSRKFPSCTCSSTFQLFVFNFSYYGSVPPILVLQLFNFSFSTFRITEASLLYLFFNFQLFVFNFSCCGSVPPILVLQLLNCSSSTFRITEVSLLYLFFNISTFRTFRITEVSLLYLFFNFSTFRLQLFVLRKCPSYTCSSTFNFSSSTFRITEVSLYTCSSTFQLFVFNCSYYGSVPPILVLQLFNFSSSTFRITEVSLLYLFFNFSTFRLQLFAFRYCPSYTCSSTFQLFVFNFSYYGSVPPILVLQLFNFSSSIFRITEVSLLYLFFNFSTFCLQLFVLRKCPCCTCSSTFKLFVFNCSYYGSVPPILFLQLFNCSSSTFRITEVSLLYLFFNF